MMKFVIFTLCLGLIQASGRQISRGNGQSDVLDPRIVGGEDAKPGELPYQAYAYGCGASIYNERWAISAAHCGHASQIFVGSIRIDESDENAQVVEVEETFINPNYSRGSDPFWLDGDIALLKLKTPLKFNDHVQPIAIPEQGYTAKGDVLISGWGSTDPWFESKFGIRNKIRAEVLQKVRAPVVEDDICQEAYKPDYKPLDQEICAGDLENGGIDSCQGDSGGPLVEIETGLLTGIVSWGAGCARPGYPGVYAEVSHYTNWIKKTVEENS